MRCARIQWKPGERAEVKMNHTITTNPKSELRLSIKNTAQFSRDRVLNLNEENHWPPCFFCKDELMFKVVNVAPGVFEHLIHL
jgi:hypothetical protein